MLCVRFVVTIKSTDPQDVANNETPRTDIVSKLRNLIFVGMTSVDSSIRALFRPLFYRMLPVDLFARLQFLFNIVLPLLFFFSHPHRPSISQPSSSGFRSSSRS